VYNEASLQRLDLILAEAGKNGVRVIFPFVNYWPDLGGMQWYVDQVRTPAKFSTDRLCLERPEGVFRAQSQQCFRSKQVRIARGQRQGQCSDTMDRCTCYAVSVGNGNGQAAIVAA